MGIVGVSGNSKRPLEEHPEHRPGLLTWLAVSKQLLRGLSSVFSNLAGAGWAVEQGVEENCPEHLENLPVCLTLKAMRFLS